MYASYRNYDAALGAATPKPGTPGWMVVPIVDVQAQLARLGFDPSDVRGGLARFVARPGVVEMSPIYTVTGSAVEMPVALWTAMAAMPPAVVTSEVFELPWTVRYRWPLIVGLSAVGVFAAYKLLWKPSRRVRMTANKRRRSMRRNPSLRISGGQKAFSKAARKAHEMMERTGMRVDWGWEPVSRQWVMYTEDMVDRMPPVMRLHSWSPRRRAAKAMTRNAKSIELDGYVFEYDGSGDGSLDDLSAAIRAPDDDWNITMVSHLRAHAVGSRRTIDDAHVTIFQGSDGRLYAAAPSALRVVTRNGRRGVPRVGTRVVFEPYPPSLALYSQHPREHEEGTVTTAYLGGKHRQYLPGPGGGLLYVDWDESGFQGVSLLDIQTLHRGKQKNWGGRFKKGGGR